MKNLQIFFTENENTHMNTRFHEKYEVLFSNTERMKKSSIVYMQNLLNEEEKEEKLKNIENKIINYHSDNI